MKHTEVSNMGEVADSINSIVEFMEQNNDNSIHANAYVPKIKDIPDGEYTVVGYEEKHTRYGISYKITAIFENSLPTTTFWSNSYLANFIIAKKPKRKFVIHVKGECITIDGYSTYVKLL